jgi:cytidylate kinase
LLVTISGLPGSGTSTVASRVASSLGLERLDGGTAFRAMAAERGLTVSAFSELAESDPSIDVDLDQRLAVRARDGDLVLESRLAGWIARNEHLPALAVWIDCDDDERARRVAAREGISAADARVANVRREASERQRYRAYYDIDVADRSIYGLVLDSTTAEPDALTSTIVAAANALW